jgi:methionyl-tRNA synthetase
MPETKDNDFTWKDFQAKNNNELVAILGNFVNRAMVLTQKYFDGKVPPSGKMESPEKELLKKISALPDEIAASLENFRFREALGSYIEIARLGNKYLADTEPWKVIRDNRERAGTILHQSLVVAARLGIFGEPFLPVTSAKIRAMLGIVNFDWDSGNSATPAEGFPIKAPQFLFEKIEDAEIDRQVQKLNATKESNLQSAGPVYKEIKPEISYEDFSKMDLRIGQIIEAKTVTGSTRLLQLKIDIGSGTRNVLSGIAEQYTPDEIIGKKVVILTNLKARKMMGMESQGMILMAEDMKGKFGFLRADEDSENGSIIS